MRRWLACVLVCAIGGAAAADPAPRPPAPDPAIDRVIGLARVWEKVKFYHPYLAYKDVDWDAALIAAIPKAEAAATPDQYRAAIAGMLAVLADPATHVVDPAAPPHPLAPRDPDAKPTKDLAPGVVAIDVGALGRYPAARAIREATATATTVVVDARTPGPDFALGAIASALPHVDELPTMRYVEHDGFAPELGNTSGNYYTTFVAPAHPLPAYEPGKGPRRAIFLVDGAHGVPALAIALAAEGRAVILSAEPLTADAWIPQTGVDAGGAAVTIRTGEPDVASPTVEIVKAPVTLDQRALAIARRPVPAPHKLARLPLPALRDRGDRGYDDQRYPPRELRMLAAIRIWAVLDTFNPYRALMDDWDGALADALPALAAANDRDAYVHALKVLVVRAHDGHVGVGSTVMPPVPSGAVPVEPRLIDGQLVVAKILDPAVIGTRLQVGDVIESIDGKPAADGLADQLAITTASTDEARRQRAAGELLAGDDGSTVALGLRGKPAVTVPRTAARPPLPPKPHWQRLTTAGAVSPSGDIGYADLTALTRDEVDRMFADLATTRAIVFDIRGYPNGTAWSIAPRINTRHAQSGAQFWRPRVSGFEADDDAMPVTFFQSLPPLPPGAAVYTGKIVVLIDDRAISQSEHTCLFFHEAANPTFIGSPTHGTNGDVTFLRVPGGLRMSFTGEGVKFVDGTQLAQRGIQPSIVVRPTIAGVRAGKDEVLARALQFLATGR